MNKFKDLTFEKAMERFAIIFVYMFLLSYVPGYLWHISKLASVLFLTMEVLISAFCGFCVWLSYQDEKKGDKNA